MKNTTIDNSLDIIDSRDIIARIGDLEGERDAHADLGPTDKNGTILPWESEYPDEAAELKALLALQEEAEGYSSDWKHGATLIHDSYFTDYAEKLVKDIGDMPRDIPDYIEIDWNATACNIQMDYASVDFDGVTYWVWVR